MPIIEVDENERCPNCGGPLRADAQAYSYRDDEGEWVTDERRRCPRCYANVRRDDQPCRVRNKSKS